MVCKIEDISSCVSCICYLLSTFSTNNTYPVRTSSPYEDQRSAFIRQNYTLVGVTMSKGQGVYVWIYFYHGVVKVQLETSLQMTFGFCEDMMTKVWVRGYGLHYAIECPHGDGERRLRACEWKLILVLCSDSWLSHLNDLLWSTACCSGISRVIMEHVDTLFVRLMCLFEWCGAMQLYTLTECISHLLLIWDLMSFPSNVAPVHNVLFKYLLVPLTKCWDLSLLHSLTQTLCPTQCSHFWSGSLSPAIILQIIPLSSLSQTKQ